VRCISVREMGICVREGVSMYVKVCTHVCTGKLTFDLRWFLDYVPLLSESSSLDTLPLCMSPFRLNEVERERGEVHECERDGDMCERGC
jgi:hypothetical protein